jgi:hypothetical protein
MPADRQFFEMQLDLNYGCLEGKQKQDFPLLKNRLDKLQGDLKNLQRKFAVDELDKSL